MGTWKELDSEVVEPDKLTDFQKELIRACNRLSVNKDFQLLLDILQKGYCMAPVCPHNQSSNYGYFREGENNIIRTLVRCCKMSINE